LVERRLAHLSDDLELVVSELATNATLHAKTAFTVGLYAFDQTLLLEVEDGSLDWPTEVSAHALDTHGRGLTIVSLFCRDWGVDLLTAGGKLVWAEFNIV
jgi:anti-sigma regulatory factor (Ser/Thr protein kinase)